MAPRRPKHPLKDRSVEHELKFRLAGAADHAGLRGRLRALGARSEGAYDEENLRFRPLGKLQLASLRLRIIDGGPAGILTAKGPARFLRGIKIREETEVEVPDVHAMLDLLEAVGHQVAFTYRKHRETWVLGDVTVTLDTFDFGFYCELEGPPEALEPAATRLGLNLGHALKMSYSALARRHLAAAAPPPLPTVPATRLVGK